MAKKKTIVLDEGLVNPNGLSDSEIAYIEQVADTIHIMSGHLDTTFKKHRSIKRAIDRLDEAYFWLHDRLDRVP